MYPASGLILLWPLAVLSWPAAKATWAILNLTFGAGGKDSDGRAVPGWGYYEVRGCVYIYSLANTECTRRRLREVLGRAQIGMEHRGSTHT